MEAGSLRSESWHAWVLLRALFQIGAFLLYPHVEDRQGREMGRGKTEKERERKCVEKILDKICQRQPYCLWVVG